MFKDPATAKVLKVSSTAQGVKYIYSIQYRGCEMIFACRATIFSFYANVVDLLQISSLRITSWLESFCFSGSHFIPAGNL